MRFLHPPMIHCTAIPPMIQMVTGLDRPSARQMLDRAEGHVKTALVMHAKSVERDEANRLLLACDGHVAAILEPEVS